jgi:hypothetical protein
MLVALVVVTKVTVAAGRDVNTALTIVGTSSKTTILFGIGILVLPSLFNVAALIASFQLTVRIIMRAHVVAFRRLAGGPRSVGFVFDARCTWLLVLTTLLLAVLAVVGSAWLLLISLAVVAGAALVGTLRLRTFRRDIQSPPKEQVPPAATRSSQGGYAVCLLAVSVFPLLIVALGSRMWLAPQQISVSGGKPLIGYVLAESVSGELTVLTERDRQVVEVPGTSVVARSICTLPNDSRLRSILEMLRGEHPRRTSRCHLT